MKTLLVSCALFALSALHADEAAIAGPLAGHWSGSARIIVDWCAQPRLPVSLDIHPDGTVTGKVGEATLTHGQLTSNRGWLGRKLNLATDYIVKGELTGPLIATEGITRSAVSIPFNHDTRAGQLTGGVHTNGKPFGGKEGAILSAASLTLTPQR